MPPTLPSGADDKMSLRESALYPSLAEWIAVVLIVAIPLVYGHAWLSADGDPGRHIRVGETILGSGLFYRDPFSFTKAGAHFIPYEWLSEVLAALSVRAAGLPGLIVQTGAVYALTYAVVARTLMRRGLGAAGTLITLLFVMALSSLHWHARPHMFTFLGAAVLMALVDRAAEQHGPISYRAVWSAACPMIPLFALWANLHGGFLYGLSVLAAVVVGDRLEMLAASGPDRDMWKGALIRHAAMLGVAFLASMLTPSGPGLYGHTVAYLRDTYLVDTTQEYWSPNFHQIPFALVAIELVVIAIALLPRRARFPTLTLIALNLGFSLMSVRNLPLFAIVVLPVVAAELQRAFADRVPAWASRWVRPAAGRSRRLLLAWPLATVVAMFYLARSVDHAATKRGGLPGPKHEFFPTTFDTRVFPVRAVRAARAAGLAGRLFSEFTWGGYILYAWPEQRVFIDGQTDFYGDSLTKEFTAMRDLKPGWRAKIAAWKIDLALLPTNFQLADALAHEPGWRPVYCDSTAVLFVRDPSRGPALGPMSALPDACASLSTGPIPVAAASGTGAQRDEAAPSRHRVATGASDDRG